MSTILTLPPRPIRPSTATLTAEAWKCRAEHLLSDAVRHALDELGIDDVRRIIGALVDPLTNDPKGSSADCGVTQRRCE